MDEHTYTGRLERWKDDKGFGFMALVIVSATP